MRLVLPLVAVVCLLAAGGAVLPGGDPDDLDAQAGGTSSSPNIVVVMTDDQDTRSMAVMDRTRALLGRRGTTFTRFFATWPLCCPSRATFLTGKYAHNHGVRGNNPPSGGFEAFRDSSTLATDLRRAGYRTGLFGKYMNGYASLKGTDQRYVPPGWTEWHASAGGLYYDLALSENGRVKRYGDDPRDYATDVVARKAERFVAAASDGRKPFFLVYTPFAPHLDGGKPPVPAPRHKDAFDGSRLPRPPSFNEQNVTDKPSFVRNIAPLGEQDIDRMRAVHEGRLESLLSVDEAIERLLERLEQEGELRDTLVIYTSDNGFLEGQHRLWKKELFYEESAGVPLIMRGPGIPHGRTRTQVTGNVDLAPTILDAAGVATPRVMDGRSLLPLARDPSRGTDRSILLENDTSVGLRTPRYLYAEHRNDERELYALREDPFQLHSLHSTRGYRALRRTLHDRLAAVDGCAGDRCP